MFQKKKKEQGTQQSSGSDFQDLRSQLPAVAKKQEELPMHVEKQKEDEYLSMLGGVCSCF